MVLGLSHGRIVEAFLDPLADKPGAALDTPKKLRILIRRAITIVNTEFGKPFTMDGFSGFMRDAITGAGLSLDAQPHGLRKAAGRRLAEAGCSAHEIMAVLGHSTLGEAKRYTREANRAILSTGAITKLEEWKEHRAAQTTSR